MIFTAYQKNGIQNPSFSRKILITKQNNMTKKIIVSVCAFLMTIMVGFAQTVTMIFLVMLFCFVIKIFL
jgi:hypothetical protein